MRHNTCCWHKRWNVFFFLGQARQTAILKGGEWDIGDRMCAYLYSYGCVKKHLCFSVLWMCFNHFSHISRGNLRVNTWLGWIILTSVLTIVVSVVVCRKTNMCVRACEGGGGSFTAAECLYREQTAASSHVMTRLITGGSSSLWWVETLSRALYRRMLPQWN